MAGNLGNAFNLLLQVHSRVVTIERPGPSEIIRGFSIATSTDLVSTLTEGVAYVEGVRVLFSTTPLTFTALKDTYIELNSLGILSYVVVPNGAQPPIANTNIIRLAKVVTDASKIVSTVQLKTPKNIYGISPVQIKVAPSNYSRNLAGPEETIVTGREFVISKRDLDLVNFPPLKRGDRIKDDELGVSVIIDVREMFGFGGHILGFRVRTN